MASFCGFCARRIDGEHKCAHGYFCACFNEHPVVARRKRQAADEKVPHRLAGDDCYSYGYECRVIALQLHAQSAYY